MRKFIFIFSLLLLCSCEKLALDEVNTNNSGNVVLKFSATQNDNITRGVVDISEAFEKLNVMVFDTSGEKVFDKVKTQSVDDDEFGTMMINLAEGTYTLIAVGHSSDKTSTIKLDKVSFTASNGKKISDTFYYYGTIVVSEEMEVYNIEMKRNVGMFRLQLTDETINSAVAKFKLDYSGGSADFNPQTGLGVTNSNQSEIRELNEDKIFDIYTFPKASTSKLKITVSALDANENIIKKRVFTDVPVSANKITLFKGNFFDGTEGAIIQSSVTITVNTDWLETKEYDF